MFFLIDYGPPVLQRPPVDQLPDGLLLFEDTAPFCLDDGTFLILE